MCGFAGIVFKNDDFRSYVKFRKSANLIQHRGPDYTGSFEEGNICLIHHRLSIIDLDNRSNQPFKTSSNSSVLVYNGELYNYRDLKGKYKIECQTSSDTEVMYKLLGNATFDYKELNGIFSLAYYTENSDELRLIRDRLGVKPLYYFDCTEFFMFASEAKVIYDYMDEMRVNYKVLSEYLTFGHANSNETIIQGVNKVPPGSILKYNLHDFSIHVDNYWELEENANNQIIPNYKEAKKHTKKLLFSAIERQCVSDVTVGAYLSGGIDSSAVVALASRYTDKKLNTYSVNFDKNPVSELKFARKIASKYGTNHHEFEITADNIEDFLPELIYQYDEPFADPAMVPLHLMAKKASGFTKVVLQGDGGDEVFAGYGRHLDLLEYRKRKLIFGLLKVLPINQSRRNRYSQRFNNLTYHHISELFAKLAGGDLSDKRFEYLFSEVRVCLTHSKSLESYFESAKRFKRLPLMQRMLFIDMANILPNKFLEKVDKVNMMHSIEARVPLLDNALVDYVMRLPQDLKIKKGTTKFFFRDILEGLIPEEILTDRKKSFGTPMNKWLTTDLFDYAVKTFQSGKKQGFPIDFDMIIKELKILSKRGNGNEGLVWKYLVLTIWLLKYEHKIRF